MKILMGLWFLVHTSNMGYFISDCFVSDCLCEGLCGQLTWSEIIKIGVFYEDKASDDESLGSVEADIGTIVQQGNVKLWLPLENVKSGQINLRCTWFTLTAKPEDLSPPDQAIIGEEMLATAALSVKLDSATMLLIYRIREF